MKHYGIVHLYIGKNWLFGGQDYVKCFIKANLTVYIADDMLRLVAHSLHSNQQFITNIAGKAYSVRHGQSKQSRPDLSSNADEADLRVWLHCKNSCGIHKLLYSPDTDVYHIGLTVLSEIPEHEVIVQLS